MELEEETKEEHWQVTRCQTHAQLPFLHSPASLREDTAHTGLGPPMAFSKQENVSQIGP